MSATIENAEKRFKDLIGIGSIGTEIAGGTLIFIDRIVITKLGLIACTGVDWYKIVEKGIVLKPEYAMTVTFSGGNREYLEIDMAVVQPGDDTHLVNVNFRYEFEMDYITATIYG